MPQFQNHSGRLLNWFQIYFVYQSNTCVERVFSVMNITKTVIYNKMQYDLLEALPRLNILNIIINEMFTQIAEMLKLFKTFADFWGVKTEKIHATLILTSSPLQGKFIY